MAFDSELLHSCLSIYSEDLEWRVRTMMIHLQNTLLTSPAMVSTKWFNTITTPILSNRKYQLLASMIRIGVWILLFNHMNLAMKRYTHYYDVHINNAWFCENSLIIWPQYQNHTWIKRNKDKGTFISNTQYWNHKMEGHTIDYIYDLGKCL